MTTTRQFDAEEASFQLALQIAFTEDPFVGMLSATVCRQLSQAFTHRLPISRAIRRENGYEDLADYLHPYAASTWPLIPLANMTTPQFKDRVVGLVGFVAVEERARYWAALGTQAAEDAEHPCGDHPAPCNHDDEDHTTRMGTHGPV